MEDDEPEPYYAHIPELQAYEQQEKTFEDCRNELISVIRMDRLEAEVRRLLPSGNHINRILGACRRCPVG